MTTETNQNEERVDIEIELDDDLILTAALEAHKKGITLNDYLVGLIEEELANRSENEDK